MKISNSIGLAKSNTFTSGCDNKLKDLFGKAKELLSDEKCLCDDVLITIDGKEKRLVKQVNERKVCISESCSGGVIFQIADGIKGIVDVIYHNPQDSFSDKYYKYKDKNIFPWFSGDDEKIFSRRIKNMSNAEVESIKNVLKKYIPEFIVKTK